MGHLSMRDYSDQELREKLSLKYTAEVVDEMLDMAWSNNWMAEPSELSKRTTQRLREKGKGFLYIQAYLKKKGLPEAPYIESEELESAQQAIHKKFGEVTEIEFLLKAKITRFLQNRGFQLAVISKILF